MDSRGGVPSLRRSRQRLVVFRQSFHKVVLWDGYI